MTVKDVRLSISDSESLKESVYMKCLCKYKCNIMPQDTWIVASLLLPSLVAEWFVCGWLALSGPNLLSGGALYLSHA